VTRVVPHLPRWLLAMYGLPGFALAGLLLPLYVYLPVYYAQDLGLGFAVTGSVLLLARLWDMATDPVMGFFSDRIVTRWGRRRPWLLIGCPVILIGIWYLFMPPAGAGWAHLLVWSIVLYSGATLVQLPYLAWGAELSPDYHERSRVTAAREAFVVCGTLAVAAFPALVGGDTAASLELIAWMLVIAFPLTIIAACGTVPERPVQPRTTFDWQQGLRLMRQNRPFRRLVAAYFLNGVANGLPASLFLLFVEHGLGRPDLSGALLFLYFLCGVGSVPVWLAASRRFGKHRVWVAAMVTACAAFVWVPMLGPGDVLWFAVICGLTGFTLGADLVLPPSMQADVIDVDTAKTGRPRTGLYFALWGLATKLALALAVGLAFPLLDLSGFQRSGGDAQTGLVALAALYSLAPVVFKLGAAALMRGFPITKERHAELRRRIAARSAAP